MSTDRTPASGLRSLGSSGTAVTSGETSRLGLPVIGGAGGTPPADTRTPPSGTPSRNVSVGNLGLTAADLEAIERGHDRRERGRDGVVGSITGFFRRCATWLSEEDASTRSRTGLEVVIEQTPAEGTVISLTRPGRKLDAAAVRDRIKERAVRAQAQRTLRSSGTSCDETEIQRRILEKQQAMLELKRRRAAEARQELSGVRIVRGRLRAPPQG